MVLRVAAWTRAHDSRASPWCGAYRRAAAASGAIAEAVGSQVDVLADAVERRAGTVSGFAGAPAGRVILDRELAVSEVRGIVVLARAACLYCDLALGALPSLKQLVDRVGLALVEVLAALWVAFVDDPGGEFQPARAGPLIGLIEGGDPGLGRAEP